MPGGLDGIEASKKIIDIDESAKIITSSGYNDESSIEFSCKRNIFSGSLAKPYDMSEMAGGSLNPTVPLPEGQLFMYANNEFSGKCCSFSNVSGGGGCACITKEQADYLNSRGGNRTMPSEY